MYKELSSKKDLKFIYAEMSFFELWWSGINDETRKIVKKFDFLNTLIINTNLFV